MSEEDTTSLSIITSILRGEAVSWPADEELSSALIDQFLKTTLSHGIQPLISYLLHKNNLHLGFPEKLVSRLSNSRRNSVIVDMLQKEELKKLLENLAEANIYPLLMKGTPLAYTLYPTIGTRPRCDADLLISKKDINPLFDVLHSLGYQYHPIDDLITRQISFSKDSNMGISYVLDVHWRINNRPLFLDTLTYGELSETSVQVPELGPHAYTLSPVHSLLLACLHRAAEGTFDENERLLWLYDVHLLVQILSVAETEQFVSLAKEKLLSSICFNALKSSNEILGTNISSISIDTIFESTPPEPSARLLKINAPRFLLKDLVALPRKKSIFCGIQEALFPPASYILHYYGVSNRLLLPWLYLHRFWRGIRAERT